MLKKRFGFIALLLAFALVVAACGDDDAETSTSASQDTTATTEAMGDEWPDTIRFGFVPSAEQTELQDDIQPFIDVLEAGLGINVEGFVTTDYNGLQVAMGTGQADFGAFATLAFVLAEGAFPGQFEPILQSVRFGSATYHTQWMVHADNADAVCATEPAIGAFENVNPDTGVRAEVGEPYDTTVWDIFDTVALNVGEVGGSTDQDVNDDGVPIDFGLACEPKADWYEALRGQTIGFTEETSTSGYAVPVYVIDGPGGGGKIPVGPNYILSQAKGKYVLRNYRGKIYTYLE